MAEMNWKDSLVEKFSIDKDMPDINFSNWESLGDEFYCLRVTDYSEYKKLMNNFNIRKLTRFDFKNIFVIMIVRSNYENSFSAGEIVYDNGLLYKERNSENKEEGPLNLTLPINIDGILDVAENAKYPGILVMVPNYMNLDNSFLKVIKQ